MTDVLIRDLPQDDLDMIRATAAAQGVSLQKYLRSTVRAQATYLRRQRVLAAVGQRLEGLPPVAESDREAVLDAVAEDHAGRAADLAPREAPWSS